MSRLYLVRHGSHGLLGKVLAGRMTGVSLSEQGRREAQDLAGFFGTVGVADIQSSPLERCLETAEPIGRRLGLPVNANSALNEIDCGAWTGQSFDTLSQDHRWRQWNAERGRTVVPGGESVDSVRDRVMALVEVIQGGGAQPAIFVTHSDIIKVVLLTLLQAPHDLHDRLDIDPASVTTVDLWPGGGKLVRSNHVLAP